MEKSRQKERYVSVEFYIGEQDMRPNDRSIWWYLEWRSATDRGAASVDEIAADVGMSADLVRRSLRAQMVYGVVARFSPPVSARAF